MIAEGYSMDVYCDNPDCEMNSRTTATYDSFIGKSKRDCDKQRVAHGWKKIKGKDMCPVCSKKQE